MNKPTILDGVTVAMVISLAAAAASLLLGGFIVYGLLFELLLYAATLVLSALPVKAQQGAHRARPGDRRLGRYQPGLLVLRCCPAGAGVDPGRHDLAGALALLSRLAVQRGTRFRPGFGRPRRQRLGHGQYRQPGSCAVEFFPGAGLVQLAATTGARADS